MNEELLSAYIPRDTNTKTILLIGGSIIRRQEIVSLLQPLQNLLVYGALSEAEAMEKLQSLPQVNIVLIGGRYSEAERVRIRAFIKQNYPAIEITEPGYQYPYSNEAIFGNIQLLLNA
jgi:hypothetical protein